MVDITIGWAFPFWILDGLGLVLISNNKSKYILETGFIEVIYGMGCICIENIYPDIFESLLIPMLLLVVVMFYWRQTKKVRIEIDRTIDDSTKSLFSLPSFEIPILLAITLIAGYIICFSKLKLVTLEYNLLLLVIVLSAMSVTRSVCYGFGKSIFSRYLYKISYIALLVEAAYQFYA